MDPTTTASDVDGKLPGGGYASLVGTILSGRYRVLSKLGAGGMGEVYTAEHRLLGCHVALKTLSPSLCGHAAAEHRFRQEAELGSELCHPNLVRVFDLEVGGPAPYFVMELLKGQDLRRLLDQEGKLSISRGVRLMQAALAGLALAHERGIVHRDLKPSNLFVVDPGPKEHCKVLDFGVARTTGRAPPTHDPLTLSDRPIGTLAYMAPEQIRSARDVDARADVYSACAILLEALSGQKRFDTDSVPEQIFRTLNETAPRLDALVPCPAGLADIVARGLSRDREDRYPDATALAQALAAFAGPDIAAPPSAASANSPPSRWRRLVTMASLVASGAVLATIPSLTSGSADPASPRAQIATGEQQPAPPPSSPPAPPAAIDVAPPESNESSPLSPPPPLSTTAGAAGAAVRARAATAGKPPNAEPPAQQPSMTVERNNPYE